jgi:hypothetical protein
MPLPWHHKPDPYIGFKNDDKRLQALKQRERQTTIRRVLLAALSSPCIYAALQNLFK